MTKITTLLVHLLINTLAPKYCIFPTVYLALLNTLPNTFLYKKNLAEAYFRQQLLPQ